MRLLAVFLATTLSAAALAQSPGNSPTPPMGWNSWNHFATRVTDADVRSAADAISTNGMRDAGYTYVNIDDAWEGTRDASGVLRSNEKFPDMKALADYVHSKGLKLGIYSSPGPKTCAKYEGSYQHEQQDADLYASWGVDYLKYDLCSFRPIMVQESGGDPVKQNQMMRAAYEKMRVALLNTHRPIVYSFCQYGWDSVWTWGPSTGANLWRTTGDINDTYDRMALIGFAQDGLEKYAGPGHWNDPDMLEVGNGRMNADEYRTHMSLWAMLAAPLLAGNDLAKMDDSTKSILLNKDVIAVDQDAMGKQGHRVSAIGPYEVWEKPLSKGAHAIALFNRGEDGAPMTLDLKKLGVKGSVRDLWAHQAVTMDSSGTYTTRVPRHGVAMFLIQ